MKLFVYILALIQLAACGTKENAQDTDEGIAAINDEQSTRYNFVPEQGKALLFIGQDSDTIGDYVEAMPEDSIEGVTLYTQIKHKDPSQTFSAVEQSDNWQSGEVNFVKTLSQVGNASLAVGLAFDRCNQPNHEKNIAQGEYDKTIDYMIDHFKGYAPRKVFLRIGYEYDGPWNCYTPTDYKLAFRKIAKRIEEKQANNITTVWQSATWPDSYGNPIYDFTNPSHLDDWYPGDDVVDWVSLSVFYRDLSQWNYLPPVKPQDAQQQVLEFARAHNKPVMISEAAPQGYRTGALTHSYIQINQQTPVSAEHIWQNWYQPFFDFIYQNNDVIKAVAYINTHWETQGMWECVPGVSAGQEGCSGGNWGDSRVQANAYIKEQWLNQVNDSARWVQTSEF